MTVAWFDKPLSFAKLEDHPLCGSWLVHDRQMPQILTQEPVTQRSRERGTSFPEAVPVARTFSFQKQRNRGPGGRQGVLPAAVAAELCLLVLTELSHWTAAWAPFQVKTS